MAAIHQIKNIFIKGCAHYIRHARRTQKLNTEIGKSPNPLCPIISKAIFPSLFAREIGLGTLKKVSFLFAQIGGVNFSLHTKKESATTHSLWTWRSTNGRFGIRIYNISKQFSLFNIFKSVTNSSVFIINRFPNDFTLSALIW